MMIPVGHHRHVRKSGFDSAVFKIDTFYSSTQSKNTGWEMPRKDEKKKLEKYLLLQRGELAGSG